MDVIECILERSRVENFSQKEVNDRLVERMLELATHAPSAGNVQAWHFIVVKDAKVKERLFEAALRVASIKSAPIAIVVCADMERMGLRYGEKGKQVYAIQDTAHASLTLALVAHALGLGCDMIRAFDEADVASILELPPHLKPTMILAIGHPAELPARASKIPFENITWLNRYGNRYEVRGKRIFV